MFILKEACVGSYVEAKRAWELGADRIELCDNLAEGGTTPSFGTIAMSKNNLDLPIFVMIRPRDGNFTYNEEEIKIMESDIEICKELKVDGIVIGALTKDNQLDEKVIKKLISKAEGLSITYHMAFNQIKDKKSAIDKLVELGVHRILTKGGTTNAMDNVDELKKLVDYANNRLVILAGGGITQDNYVDIVDKSGVKEVHGRKIVGKLQ